MSTTIRPMLAAKFEECEDILPQLRKLHYPLLASPKIDGFRFLAYNGVAMSRSWKPLPNKHIQNFFKMSNLHGLDGEIIIGCDPTAKDLFNITQSAVMTRDGEPNFQLCVFDCWDQQQTPFITRHHKASDYVDGIAIEGVDHHLIESPEQVLMYEAEALSAGYEGIMLRRRDAPYKYGRSTLREQGLIKVKRFTDEEAIVMGFEPLERNQNVPTLDAFGLQKRSSHKANKKPDELLGKLLVTSPKWGDFAIGSGFDVATREAIWLNQSYYLGRIVTFKYQAHGTKDKPRIPIFKGFRPESE